MERRSFLAMLGLAPVVAATGAHAREPVVPAMQDGALRAKDVIDRPPTDYTPMTHSWSCPDFNGAQAAAAERGKELKPNGFEILYGAEVPAWLRAKMPEWQDCVATSTYEGRIVQALWWVR